MRSLPRIVSKIPSDIRSFLDRVREYLGEGGDGRFVTVRELRIGGIIGTTPNGTITAPTEYGVELPTQPTGLSTTSGLASIFVEWDTPAYRGHLRTEVWGAATNDFTAKALLGTSPSLLYVDNLGGGGTRYYWLRFINLNETAGPFSDINGVVGTAAEDPTYLLEVLADSITESQLYSELNDRIDLIDGSAAVTGTIPNQLALLQGQIDELNATPDYDNAVTYAIGDIVQYSGGLYQAIAATTGNLPTNTTYWLKIGDYSSLGDAVAAHTTDISNLTTNLGAETTARELLAAQMRGTYTGTDLSLVTSGLIFSEREARATAVSSEATTRESLATQVRGSYTGSDINALSSGLIYSERLARSTADSSEVTARETLATQVRGSYTGTDVTALTSGLVFSERTARVSADSALSSSITTINTTLGNQSTSIQTLTQSVDGVKGLYTVKIDNNGNVGGFGLESVLDNVTIALWAASVPYNIGAVRRVSSVTTKVMVCRTAGTSGTSTPTLSGAVGTTFTDGTVTWEIASSTATSTFITNVDRFAVTVPSSSVPARVNSTSYSVNSTVKVASSTSKYLVCKTAGTTSTTAPNIASTAIGTLVTDGSVVWQVSSTAPFVVVTGNTTIDGVTFSPGTYIDGAAIVNATITNAAIGDAAITNAKIANLAADKITAGTMQVGSFIQSQSYATGSTGWKINADGTAEFSQAVVRGSIFGGSATSFASGTGLFAGLDGATYKFRVGTATGNRLFWDGTSLNVVGTVSGSTILGGSATSYTSGTGLFAGLDGATYKLRVGDPSGAYFRWTGSALELSSSATIINTTNITNNAVTETYIGRLATEVLIGSTLGVDVALPSITIPFAGRLVTTFTSIFHNFSDSTTREVQVLHFVNNEADFTNFPILRMAASGSNAAFFPISPLEVTRGCSLSYTSAHDIPVVANQVVPFDITAIPNANSSALYLIEAYYVATLYKK